MKIGFVPTRRTVFSTAEAIRYKTEIRQTLSGIGGVDILDIEGINEEGLLFDEQDVSAIVERMREVDGVFFPHCNFGSEALVAKVAKALGKPVLLWGPRDDAPLQNGVRTRDTQCGLFATGKILRRFGVPFTYLTNSRCSEPYFKEGYRRWLRVCRVVKAARNLRILQIAPRPDSFWTMMVNEGELLEKFGVMITPISLSDLSARVAQLEKEQRSALQQQITALRQRFNCSHASEAEIVRIAALKLAVLEFCRRFDCKAVAIQCWNAMQDAMQIMPCLANGLLADDGIPVACETDIHGAISSLLLQASSDRTHTVFFADLTVRHPENDNAELLWHCGNFPPSLAKDDTALAIDRHFIFDSHCAGTGEFELKAGPITICRFDGDNGQYRLLIGEGKSVAGPATKGTYVWLEVKDWPAWEHKIVTGPYVHHCAGLYDSTAAVLWEACRYIPGLEADLADENEAEMRRIWIDEK